MVVVVVRRGVGVVKRTVEKIVEIVEVDDTIS